MCHVQHERELYLVKKKLSQAGPAPVLSPARSPAPTPLSIPRYLTVGTGKTSYTEYEVRLVAARGGEAGRDQQVSTAEPFPDLSHPKYSLPVQPPAFTLVPCTAVSR